MKDSEILEESAQETHSIFGASGAKTWRNCPGSPQAIETAKMLGDIPENRSSEYADEGTIAHKWAEKVLNGEADLSEVPDAMRIYVQGYTDICLKSAKGAESVGGVWMVERMVPLFYRLQDHGKCDFVSYSMPSKEIQGGIHMIDYKHGAGEKVDAEDNDQQAIYGISLIGELEKKHGTLPDDMRVALAIYQPRHRDFDGLDIWNTTVRELKDIAIDIEADYKRSQDGSETQLNPSHDACMFCDLKTVCEARGQTSFGGLPPAINPLEDFDDETYEEEKATAIKEYKKGNGTFTPQQIAFICKHGSAIKKIVDDVAKGERERIEGGGEVRGMKLIKGGLKPRQWNDEEAAEKLIKNKLGAAEAYHPRKFLTAPQALEKLKGEEVSTKFQNKLDSLIHRPPGNPKLVPIDAKGEALVFTTPQEDFEDEIEPEEDFSDLM